MHASVAFRLRPGWACLRHHLQASDMSLSSPRCAASSSPDDAFPCELPDPDELPNPGASGSASLLASPTRFIIDRKVYQAREDTEQFHPNPSARCEICDAAAPLSAREGSTLSRPSINSIGFTVDRRTQCDHYNIEIDIPRSTRLGSGIG